MSKSRAEVNAYFHGQVNLGSGNSADYVVSHGERQKQRGKQPSVVYRGLLNPRAALAAALSDIEARTTRTFIGKEIPAYREEYSGRIAVIHAQDDAGEIEWAREFAKARMEDGRCTGAVILNDFEEIIHTLPSDQVNPNGTTEVAYLSS